MIRKWIEQMNKRERLLASAVAGIVFLLINLFVWSWLLGAISQSQTELTARRAARQEEAVYMKERDIWAKRDQWLQQHQPVMKGAAEPSVLLDELKPIAAKHNVLIENPSIATGEVTPNHQTVSASFETKSPWGPLLHFLYDVQRPEAFIVFESVNLAVDGAEPSMMRGKFKVARWFAPAQPRPKG